MGLTDNIMGLKKRYDGARKSMNGATGAYTDKFTLGQCLP